MTLFFIPLNRLASLVQHHLRVIASVVLVLMTGGSAWADPPTRAGRIAEVSGSVWLFDPDGRAWVRVLRNQTIGQGDQLRTDARSRVTVRIGSSTVWLDEESDLELLQLDEAALQMRLVTGDVALRLRTAQAAQETRVQTREGVISPEMEGLFRVDQLDRGTRMAVLQGRAQFDADPAGPVQRAWLREGEQAEFWRADAPRIERQPVSRDKFSAWFLNQDQVEGAISFGDAPYVSPEMTGAEDLNQHGNWEVAVEYGNVWIPSRVAVGWEPYRDGRWVWTRQWGWSWVDNAPWGFAPFHYGRWVQYRNRWAWAPGRFEPRPAYAPALVAWVGGPKVSIGVSVGGVRTPPQVGWAPLPPRQSYVPIHAHSPQYGDRFRWDREPQNNSRYVPNDRMDRPARSEPQRGDIGPQRSQRPSDLTTAPETQPNPLPAVVPWGAGRQQGEDRRGDRRDPRPDRQPIEGQPLPVQVAPPVPLPLPAPRPSREGEVRDTPYGNDRPDRNRESGSPSRGQVPMFNRDGAGVAPAQTVQRPVPVQSPVAQPQPQQPVFVGPTPVQRPRPVVVDDEDVGRNRNPKLRERQERAGQDRDSR